MTAAPRPKRVLFVCYGGGHATMAVPVVKALVQAAPEVEAVVMGLTMAKKTFRDAGIPSLGFAEFIDPVTDGPALARGRAMMGDNHAPHTDIPEAESIAYLGINMTALEADLGAEAAAAEYARIGRQAFHPLAFMHRVLDRVAPDMVVTTTSPRSELAARRAAEARGIPTLLIADVLTRAHFLPEMHVDHLCVPGRTARDILAAAPAVEAGQIHMTGNPAMDALAAGRDRPVNSAWRDRVFPTATPPRGFVLVAEQYAWLNRDETEFIPFTEAEILANLDRLQAAITGAGAVSLIRPHPSLPPELYEGWVAAQGGRAFMANTQDLGDLLNVADVVVSNFSTIMLDALYAKTPVLLVNYPDSGNLMPFDRMGFATGVAIADAADLARGLAVALDDKAEQARQFEAFEADFAALPAAPKIAVIIADQLKGQGG